jgi:hypothetical protein
MVSQLLVQPQGLLQVRYRARVIAGVTPDVPQPGERAGLPQRVTQPPVQRQRLFEVIDCGRGVVDEASYASEPGQGAGLPQRVA